MENNKLTTEEDFQFFKSEALRFMELFGIKDWEVFFTHENEYPDDRAWVLFKANAHIARISLNKDWSRQDLIDQIKPELLSRAAFHEVCHLFFSRIETLAESRYLQAEDIYSEIHRLIVSLEEILWKRLINDRCSEV